LFYYLIYLIYFLGEYFYLKSEFSNIIILLNIITLFMSLDLTKNEKKLFNNLFIEEYYIALSIKYLNNFTLTKEKFKMDTYIKTIVSML